LVVRLAQTHVTAAVACNPRRSARLKDGNRNNSHALTFPCCRNGKPWRTWIAAPTTFFISSRIRRLITKFTMLAHTEANESPRKSGWYHEMPKWTACLTSELERILAEVAYKWSQKKRATRVWTLADILTAWPDCATSSALPYSNLEAKVFLPKPKDLAQRRTHLSSKKSSPAMQFFPRTRSPLTVGRNWFNFSSCTFCRASRHERGDRLHDAGT